MPHLRITARTIPIDVRRDLVNELTSATLRLMPSERASWTNVHFTDIDPERFATESRLVIDGQTPNVQLEFIAPDIPARIRRELVDRLTGILMNAYKMHGEDICRVNIKFTAYDAARDFAVGGRKKYGFHDRHGFRARHAGSVGESCSPRHLAGHSSGSLR